MRAENNLPKQQISGPMQKKLFYAKSATQVISGDLKELLLLNCSGWIKFRVQNMVPYSHASRIHVDQATKRSDEAVKWP